jgi:hypothetical protein
MPTRQGDVSLLQDPVAQELLQAKVPARLAYVWSDGTPRVVPIGFHWTGEEVVLGTPADAPKLRALTQNPKVALTIDTDTFPYKVLLLRGTATVDVVAGIPPEYAQMCRRNFGEEGARAWLAQVEPLLPAMGGMTRVAIRPEWVGILDFEQRFPSAIERAVAATQAGA